MLIYYITIIFWINNLTNNVQVTDGSNILLVATSLFEKLRSRTISSILKDIRAPAQSGFLPTPFSSVPLKSLTNSLIINMPPPKFPTTKSSLPLLSSSIKDRTSSSPLSLFNNNNQQKHQPIPFFSNQVLFGPPIIPSIEIPVFEPINHWTTTLDNDQSDSRSVLDRRKTRQRRPESSPPSSSSNELLLSIPLFVQEQDWPLLLLDNKSLFEQSQQHQSFRPELAETNFQTFISTIVNNNKLQQTNDGTGNLLPKQQQQHQHQQLFKMNPIHIDPNFIPLVNYSKMEENSNLRNQFYYQPTNYKWNKTIPIDQSFIILNTSQELLETSENRNLKQNDLTSQINDYLNNNYNRQKKPSMSYLDNFYEYNAPDQQYFSHQSKLLESDPNHINRNMANNVDLSNPYSFYLNKHKTKPEQNYFQIFDIVENGVNPELVELIEFETTPESYGLANSPKPTASSQFSLPTNTNWPYNSRYIPVINDIINNNETMMASSNLQNNYELKPKNQTNIGRVVINGTNENSLNGYLINKRAQNINNNNNNVNNDHKHNHKQNHRMNPLLEAMEIVNGNNNAASNHNDNLLSPIENIVYRSLPTAAEYRHNGHHHYQQQQQLQQYYPMDNNDYGYSKNNKKDNNIDIIKLKHENHDYAGSNWNNKQNPTNTMDGNEKNDTDDEIESDENENHQGKKKYYQDKGHVKHGWKNVYHKEEYAEANKYHDIWRYKDWKNRFYNNHRADSADQLHSK